MTSDKSNVIELKLKKNVRIAEAEYDEKKNLFDETFSHLVIRLEWELRMKSKADWKNVVWRYKGEDDDNWKPFFISKSDTT